MEQTPSARRPRHSRPKSEVEARQAALLRRISTVLDEYAAPSPGATSLDASLEALGALLDAHSHDKPLAWLSFIAIVSQYPTSEDMVRFSTDVIVNARTGRDRATVEEERRTPTVVGIERRGLNLSAMSLSTRRARLIVSFIRAFSEWCARRFRAGFVITPSG